MPFSPCPQHTGCCEDPQASCSPGPAPGPTFHAFTPKELRAAGDSPVPLLSLGARKSYPCKFPGQLGHKAFGSRAQRSHRRLPARVENYHVPRQGLLGRRQRATGSGWHQPLPGSRESHGKAERRALRGWSSEWQSLQNKGGRERRPRGGWEPVRRPCSRFGGNANKHRPRPGLRRPPALPPQAAVSPL